MPEKSKKFRRDKESKIDSIIQSTIGLIEEKGYSGFSIDEVPERANLSIGTVYRYFPKGKRDILHEIITRNNEALTGMIPQDEISDKNFYDFWKSVIIAYLRGHRDGIFSLTAMEYSLGADHQFSEVLGPIVIEFFQKLAKQISGVKQVAGLSEREVLEKVGLVFGILGLLVKSHVTRPFFKSDDRLVEYVSEVARLTFEMKI